jgi:hypothetical protein
MDGPRPELFVRAGVYDKHIARLHGSRCLQFGLHDLATNGEASVFKVVQGARPSSAIRTDLHDNDIAFLYWILREEPDACDFAID